MVQTHRRKSSTPKAHQRTGKTAVDRQSRIVRQQSTIDKWNRGTAAIEEAYAKVRATKHVFVPMGRLPACEKCGSGVDELLGGKRVHFEVV